MAERYILVMNGRETARVKLDDVRLIVRDRRKIHIVAADRQYDFYEKIEKIEAVLDNRFFASLKGCYVNLEHISYMADQCIYFDNGYVYNLGRDNFTRTKQRYRGYLQNVR